MVWTATGATCRTERQDDVNASTSPQLHGTSAAGAPYAYKMAYGVVQSAATYYAGGALGYRVNDSLRVGAGLFTVYERLGSFFDFGSTLDVGAAHSTGVLERKATVEVFGARATAGLQWLPGDDWEIGFVARSPVVAFAGTQRITGIDQATVPGQAPTLVLFDRDTPFESRRGAEIDCIDHIGSARINYYGAMLGVEYRRRYEGDHHDSADPLAARGRAGGLEFSTTIAMRYALGRGTVQGARIEPLSSAPNDYSPIATDTTVHELNLHIGRVLLSAARALTSGGGRSADRSC